jgi:hypothetical protein
MRTGHDRHAPDLLPERAARRQQVKQQRLAELAPLGALGHRARDWLEEGAVQGYPALSGVVDPHDYLPDTIKASLLSTASGLPVYPARLIIV